MSWVNDRLAPGLAHYWPMTDRRVLGARSPYGFAPRSPSGWPDCWFEHPWVRDLLLTVYVWDQEIATGSDGTAGAARAAYHEHMRNVVVPEVQQIASMCGLGHMDPAERPMAPGPWQPAPPPPLPGVALRSKAGPAHAREWRDYVHSPARPPETRETEGV